MAKCRKSIPYLWSNGWKTIPVGPTQSYITHVRQYPPSPDCVSMSLKLIASRIRVFYAASFRGQNLLKPCPDWSPLGVTKSLSHAQKVSFRVKFKISDELPRLFHMGELQAAAESALLWRKGDDDYFSKKLRVRIKDNKNSPHGKFHRFLFPFSSKFSDLNFASYVLYNLPALCHVSHTVSLGYLCW